MLLVVICLLAGIVAGLPASWTSLFPTSACSPTNGLTPEPPLCSSQEPCLNLLSLYNVDNITEPTHVPTACASAIRTGPNARDDGAPGAVTIDSRVHYYCQGTGAPGAMLPLLLFFHGSGGTVEKTYSPKLGLRQRADTYEIKPGSPGYVFLSLQGPNRHWPTLTAEDGSKHDFVSRDFASNHDFKVVDALVDSLVAAGTVDPEWIFTSGHSNGAHFAQSYAIVRHVEPTPGGSMVKAAAVYSAFDPFGPVAGDTDCRLASYPPLHAPVLVVANQCDIWPCQQFRDWDAANPNATVVYLNDAQDGEVADCVDYGVGDCTFVRGALRHMAWPTDFSSAMLDFLRDSGTVPDPTGSPTTTPRVPTAAPTRLSRAASLTPSVFTSAMIALAALPCVLALGW
mmetsp:Transcript_428/g.562  ORF Transcript_428/g.562 Transcript_428/m.562 type:complete len:398 (-) Transcript_428:341-1534(-)|eukprot:CAMPEP_0175096692 /NCGR_PEP_ID=MMETSP0086_2-20121207/4873_1 /TAXON_ID=136419 /ORGANISM="Unknown Unknown, Strain D1" /LENGTH=397 /DNA_ID=CAMNT_0016370121 /DNA_START=116 /DNA_END=1309 /DNA_ORIENTATION=-